MVRKVTRTHCGSIACMNECQKVVMFQVHHADCSALNNNHDDDDDDDTQGC